MSKARKVAGVSTLRRSIRDSAGWMRLPRTPNSWPPSSLRINDLAVDHVTALGEHQLGEIALQRLAVARLQVDLVAVHERERAKAVPLGLVGPSLPFGQLGLAACQLREDGGRERKGHDV